MRTLGIIPARGGSKGVIRKNAKLLGGKPLVAYTIEAALATKSVTRLILSTDDESIARVGREWGVDAPFLRPAELATDQSPMLPVIQHAVRWLEEQGEQFDAVCLLQPTNPFRTPADIDGCIALLEQSQADAVVSILPVPAEHNPYWVYFLDSSGALRLSTGGVEPITRRQDLPPAFHREGSVYVTRRDVVMTQNSLYGARLVGYPVPGERALNIDDSDDWLRAERLLQTLAADSARTLSS
jgi:CMP-N-acetylneuraminic acid synthetase